MTFPLQKCRTNCCYVSRYSLDKTIQVLYLEIGDIFDEQKLRKVH